MIDLAAAALQANPALGQLPWADLGTGSGVLAIGAAKLLLKQQQQQQQKQQQQQRGPDSVRADGTACVAVQVYAVDLSATAAAYATANAAACRLQDAVKAVQGSWYEPLLHLEGRLGCVLSNPPYIPRAEIEAGLQAEVGQHEPMLALDGGPGTGMDSLQVRGKMELPGGGAFDVWVCVFGGGGAKVGQQELMSVLDGGRGAGMDSLQVFLGGGARGRGGAYGVFGRWGRSGTA
jgi:release factor glutamine methyltransferase